LSGATTPRRTSPFQGTVGEGPEIGALQPVADAKVVSHGRYVTCQMAEVAVPRQTFQEILSLMPGSGRRPRRHDPGMGCNATRRLLKGLGVVTLQKK